MKNVNICNIRATKLCESDGLIGTLSKVIQRYTGASANRNKDTTNENMNTHEICHFTAKRDCQIYILYIYL